MKNILFCGLMFVTANIEMSYGQVLIGRAGIPAEGAILDLKDKDIDINNVSANKGFLMPRVMLTDLTKLVPLVQKETTENKKEHIGLQVYHVGGGTSTITPGLKIWNGVQWDEIFSSPKGQWVYMPPFSIKMFEATEQKIVLYEEYKKQLNKANGSLAVWAESDVDFVITGFDSNAFSSAPTIKVENNRQTLVYTAAQGKLSAGSYLNIIVVKK
ncbi:hypothetical protein [Myroides odoratimimus]|uniref:hypothetical protein n=1 Tax=Myroides odoratimimus TaxID=76832 RepID=UPI00046826B4|nr:hypothetical protein [Myroides odoratimimus]